MSVVLFSALVVRNPRFIGFTILHAVEANVPFDEARVVLALFVVVALNSEGDPEIDIRIIHVQDVFSTEEIRHNKLRDDRIIAVNHLNDLDD